MKAVKPEDLEEEVEQVGRPKKKLNWIENGSKSVL